MTDSVEAFLSRLHHPALAGIDLSLDRMNRLLMMLGSPHKRLPPVIHVAGTNGKGSLLAYLQSIFETAGLRVHRYTSPHLVRFAERIILQGREIENPTLERILKHMAPALAQQPATFFEATTAAAFLAFSEKPADVLLLETGMGGRLDATNVVEKPLLTAITPVSYDHLEYLGDTLPAIAGEKAGILKKGVPCIVGRQEPEAAAVIAAKAAEFSEAPKLIRLGQEWTVENRRYVSGDYSLKLAPALHGEFQYDNAATAVACVKNLPFAITDEQIQKGLSNAIWPARLQRLHGNWQKLLPSGVELWLDGGHNPQGGQVLADWLSEQNNPEIYLVCGMMKGKDPKAFLKPLKPFIHALVGVTIPGETQAAPAAAIAAAATELGLEAQAAESAEKALQTIGERAKTGAIVCICGSLYLAGKILARN